MARLQSRIGDEQRKHTPLRTKAGHYQRMAEAIRVRDHSTIATFPKYVPREKSPDWYLERAEQYERESETAGEMADLLHDMEQRNRWEAMTAEDAWRRVVTGHDYPGMTYRSQGLVEFFIWMVDMHLEEIHALVPKLSREQREEAQGLIRSTLEELLNAFQ